MKTLMQKFKNNFDTVREEEAGDVIQNVLIIAVFVIIVGFIGKLLYDAITTQGNKTADCIAKIGGNVSTVTKGTGC